jgi:hypothetical protein
VVFLFSPWPTPDPRPHGWTLVEYLPLTLRPVGGTVPPIAAGLRIEVVRDEAGLQAFEAAMVRGFQMHAFAGQGRGAAIGAGMLVDERQRLWVGWEGDRPVSASATFVTAGINDVTLVATVPEARGRGYGAALTWRATVADAALPALLIATAEGRSVYECMGSMSLFRFALWSRERPSRGTSGPALPRTMAAPSRSGGSAQAATFPGATGKPAQQQADGCQRDHGLAGLHMALVILNQTSLANHVRSASVFAVS